MDHPGSRVSTTDPAHRVRRAVQDSLADLTPETVVVIAVSGGPDSLALARAAARLDRPVVAAIVDHGLQSDSAEIAQRAAAQCTEFGIGSVIVTRVEVSGHGSGPEAAARDARRAALETIADDMGAGAILTAHTRDDQAETVLLRLARGSGSRSLAAMAAVSGRWRRPLLDVPRQVVHASVDDITTWRDPHNADPVYARSRVRHHALPALVDALGPEVIDGLARSARLLRDDADALDLLADRAGAEVTDSDGTLDAAALLALPRAVRTRILHRAAVSAGCPASALTSAHVGRLEALVSDWRGQGPVDLPGGIAGQRTCGRLTLHRVPPVADRRRDDRKE